MDQKNGDNGQRVSQDTGPKSWRDLLAFWLIGLCSNYGYFVMLIASHDILEHFSTTEETRDLAKRQCTKSSTGWVLLAAVFPSLLSKLLSPILPSKVHFRVLSCCLFALGGYLLIFFAKCQWVALLGVVFISIDSGLSEITFLAYTANYHSNVVYGWSSGNGSSSILASGTYAGLSAVGLGSTVIIGAMAIIPIIKAISFWIILRHEHRASNLNHNPKHLACIEVVEAPSSSSITPNTIVPAAAATTNTTGTTTTSSSSPTLVPSLTILPALSQALCPATPNYNLLLCVLLRISKSLCQLRELLLFVTPLTLVLFIQNLINQGLLELHTFPTFWASRADQFRWLQLAFTLGLFLSTFFARFVPIRNPKLFLLLQMGNFVYLTADFFLQISPTYWLVVGIIFYEGLNGGFCYANTFHIMSRKSFSLEPDTAIRVGVIMNSLGLTLAGITAIPYHNFLCTFLS